jgi:hypothetical protein
LRQEVLPPDAFVVEISYASPASDELSAMQQRERVVWRGIIEKERRRRDYAEKHGLSLP